MSFGEGNLRERLAALEGIAAEMCRELRGLADGGISADAMDYEARLAGMGIEVTGRDEMEGRGPE